MLERLETLVRLAGAIAIGVTLAVIFYGLWQGVRRPVGRTTGRMPGLLRSGAFYLAASIAYFGICWLLWIPLPATLLPAARAAVLILGSVLLFAGLGLVLWGRQALGKQYFASTSMGAQLFAGHRLVTEGPYALMRHPMYLGYILTGAGGLLVYRTWTFVFIAVGFLGLAFRARREEQALEAEFGEVYQAYCQRVPGWMPWLRRQQGQPDQPPSGDGASRNLEEK
jgi:protein-S-isoprenylcysteine O-methyltransferase Ste14